MERLTGALLDRLTHHVHILEINGECYRLKQSRQTSVMPTSDCPETPLPGRLEMTPLRITHPDIFAGQLAMTLMLDGVLPGALFDRSSGTFFARPGQPGIAIASTPTTLHLVNIPAS